MNSDHELDRLLKEAAAAHRPSLPSPDLIWWRAHMLRKQDEKQRIERPILIVRRLAIAVCTVILLALLVNNWALLMNSASAPLVALGILALAVPLVSVLILFMPPAKG